MCCSSEVVELGCSLDGHVVTGLPVMRPGPDHRWLLTVAVIRTLREGLVGTDDQIPAMPERPRPVYGSPWSALHRAVMEAHYPRGFWADVDLPDLLVGPWANPWFGGWTWADRVAVHDAIVESNVLNWQRPERFRSAREEFASWLAEHVGEAVHNRLSIRSGLLTAQ